MQTAHARRIHTNDNLVDCRVYPPSATVLPRAKPYTPDDPDLSYNRNRDVYDLLQAQQSPRSRVRPPRFPRRIDYPVENGSLKVHVGLEKRPLVYQFLQLSRRPHCPARSAAGRHSDNRRHADSHAELLPLEILFAGTTGVSGSSDRRTR
jgi:hypothetical protein